MKNAKLRVHIIHNVGIDISEIKDHFDLTTESTKASILPKFNPYFKSIWGDFDAMRALFGDRVEDVRCFITSDKALKQVGITGHLGMYDMLDRDGVIDFYIGVPDVLDKRAKKNGFKTNLGWLFIHELCHGLEQELGGPDRTHEMESQGRLQELYTEDVRKRFLKTKLTLLQKLVALFVGDQPLIKYQYPIPVVYFQKHVSQKFGVPNKAYRSGIHNGTDFATPVGTKCYAPVDDFEVYKVFKNHNTMGNAAYCKGMFNGMPYWFRFLHLEGVPTVGTYKRGDVIEWTGNTGASTGPHLHLEVWRVPVDTSLLYSRKKVEENLLDPEVFFRDLMS